MWNLGRVEILGEAPGVVVVSKAANVRTEPGISDLTRSFLHFIEGFCVCQVKK